MSLNWIEKSKIVIASDELQAPPALDKITVERWSTDKKLYALTHPRSIMCAFVPYCEVECIPLNFPPVGI